MTISQTIKLEDKASPVFASVKKNATAVLKVYEDLDKKQSELAASAARIRVEYGENSALYKTLAKGVREYGDELKQLIKTGKLPEDELTKTLEKANELQSRLTSNVRGSTGAMQTFYSIIRKVAAVFGVKSLMNMSDSMTQLEARLGLALSSNNWSGTAEQFSNSIFAAARRSRSDYNTLSGTISKLGMQAGGAFGGPNELIKFAENLNKIFITSGLDSGGIQSVMYNLTQSMSTGHLLGNDYRILKMNAPELVNMLKKTYANNDQSTLDQMVSKGQITAQMLKEAIINNTDEINAKFEQMPVTWEQVWIRIKNTTQRLLKPILKIVSNLAKTFDNALTWIEDHWKQLQPVIITGLGIITAMITALIVKKIALNAATVINTVATYAEAKAFLASAAAAKLKATAEGQATIASLESSMAAGKATIAMFKLVAAVAIVIAAAYGISWVFEKVTGKSMDAIGLLLSALFMVVGFIYDIVVVPLYNMFANLVNFFANVWKDPIANVELLFIGFAQNILNALSPIAGFFDTILHTNLSSGINNMIQKLNATESNIKLGMDYEEVIKPLESLDIVDFMHKGYDIGVGFSDSIKNAFDDSKLSDALTTGTDGMDALNVTSSGGLLNDEDVQLLLDIAGRDFKLNYQALTPEISVTFTGDINETADVEGIYETIVTELEEGLNSDLGTVMA